MYVKAVYLLGHYVQQLDSVRTGNMKSLDMTLFVTSQMNLYNAQQRVGYNKRTFGPQNQFMVRTLQGRSCQSIICIFMLL